MIYVVIGTLDLSLGIVVRLSSIVTSSGRVGSSLGTKRRCFKLKSCICFNTDNPVIAFTVCTMPTSSSPSVVWIILSNFCAVLDVTHFLDGLWLWVLHGCYGCIQFPFYSVSSHWRSAPPDHSWMSAQVTWLPNMLCNCWVYFLLLFSTKWPLCYIGFII